MAELSDRESDWLRFSLSYISLAYVGCQEMLQHKYYNELEVKELYIATIYNVKHGIESFIKSAIVILNKKNILKKDKNHNAELIFDNFLDILNKHGSEIGVAIAGLKQWASDTKVPGLVSEIDKFIPGQEISKLRKLVQKYQRCEFIKGLIGDNYSIIDYGNEAFRYPQNELQIELDYGKILAKVSDSNIYELVKDIHTLKETLYIFWLIFTHLETSDLNEEAPAFV